MMFRLIAVAFSLSLSGLVQAESLRIEPKHATFDAATAFSTVRQSYTLINDGDRPVAIRSFKSIAGPGDAKNLPSSLQPGESKVFQIELILPGQPGSSLNRFALFTDEADVERYRFTLSGLVYSLVEPQNAQLDFGRIAAASDHPQSLTFDTREPVALRFSGVSAAPDWLEASVDGSTISARLRANAPLGMQAGTIKVATNLPQQPFVEVLVKAIIEGRLTPSTYGLGMKPQTVGSMAEASIEIAYSGASDLAKLKTEALPGWKVSTSACGSKPAYASQCSKITMRKRLDETGRFTGFLHFRLDGEPTLSVPFGYMALGKDQTVRELVLNDAGESANPGYTNFQQALTDALSGKPAEPAPAKPAAATKPSVAGEKIAYSEGKAPVKLNWSAANDTKIHGYMVYRAEDRAGPFQRVSDQPVPRAEPPSDGSALAKYSFVDAKVVAGKTYYYYIDSLADDGSQQRFSPVLSKKVLP